MLISRFTLISTLINTKLILSFHISRTVFSKNFLSMDYFNKKASDSSESVTAGGIILYRINKNNCPEFLLLKSHREPFHYTPPKGRLEENETFGEAAKRETLEESGISPEMYEIEKNFAKSMKYQANDKGKECIYFLAKLYNPTTSVVLSEEHSSYEWADLERMKRLCSHQMIIDVIIQAHNHITHTP